MRIKQLCRWAAGRRPDEPVDSSASSAKRPGCSRSTPISPRVRGMPMAAVSSATASIVRSHSVDGAPAPSAEAEVREFTRRLRQAGLHDIREEKSRTEAVRRVGERADRVLQRVAQVRPRRAEGHARRRGSHRPCRTGLRRLRARPPRPAATADPPGRLQGQQRREGVAPDEDRRLGRTGRGAGRPQCSDSTAWTSASMPAYAETVAGALTVSSGSTMAARGIRYGLETPTFISRSGSATTATGVTSEPVPAVVGTATTGVTGPGTAFSP